MGKMEIKAKIKKELKKTKRIQVPQLARLLRMPSSKARQIMFDLEIEGFLERVENKAKKYVLRYWQLKTVDVEKNDFSVPLLNQP